MWKSSRKDLIPTFVTFLLCLAIGVEYGILVGVGINIVFLLYPSARPTIHVEKCVVSDKKTSIHTNFSPMKLHSQTDSGAEYLLVTPGNSLYFPAVDFIRQSVGRAARREGCSQLPIVVDCRFVLGADFTAAKAR